MTPPREDVHHAPGSEDRNTRRFRGGVRVGALFNASWPFATLTLSTDGVVLQVFFQVYRLARNEIQDLTHFRKMFSRGVKISHCSPLLDPHLVFWSADPQLVLSTAARMGYPAADCR
jgi:hypothetical protein